MIMDIDVGYACYWVEAEGVTVTKAPPIARWMIGRHIMEVLEWVASKHGRAVVHQ